jgi:hypothetical protein
LLALLARKDEVIAGRYLRTLSDSFEDPAETLAKVDPVGTTWHCGFVFTFAGKHQYSNSSETHIRPKSKTYGKQILHTLKW